MTKKIFLIAGEVSGDLLGGALMQDFKALDNDVEFSGIGGTEMTAQGLQSLFPMQELSIMGLVEVLKHLPLLYRRFNQTVKAILEQNPDVLVTIDAPDFGLRVAKKIKKLRPSIKTIHYVAPTVWAWRPGRAKKIAQYLDGIMCLFPFEPPYFVAHGMKAAFVGHPIAKTIPEFTDQQKADFCRKHNLETDKPILCVLPGSRVREVQSLLPIIHDTIMRLKENVADLQIIIPTLPHLVSHLQELTFNTKIIVPETTEERYLAFATSTVALHASGTVALELALCGTPMVTIYKLGKLTAKIAKRLIKTPFANLVNILLRHPAVPECIQEEATPENVAPIVQALLTNKPLRELQAEELSKIRIQLAEPKEQAAASFVQSFI